MRRENAWGETRDPKPSPCVLSLVATDKGLAPAQHSPSPQDRGTTDVYRLVYLQIY